MSFKLLPSPLSRAARRRGLAYYYAGQEPGPLVKIEKPRRSAAGLSPST